jgi:hypothetical protein
MYTCCGPGREGWACIDISRLGDCGAYVAFPFVEDKRENGKQNEIPPAINCTTVNIRRHNSLLFQAFRHHLNVNSLYTICCGNEGTSESVSDADRHVIIRELLDFIFSKLHSFEHPSGWLHNVWSTPILRAEGF